MLPGNWKGCSRQDGDQEAAVRTTRPPVRTIKPCTRSCSSTLPCPAPMPSPCRLVPPSAPPLPPPPRPGPALPPHLARDDANHVVVRVHHQQVAQAQVQEHLKGAEDPCMMIQTR